MHETKLTKRLSRYAGDHDMTARYALRCCGGDSGAADTAEARALNQAQADTANFMLGLAKDQLPGALSNFTQAANQFSDPAYATRMAGQAGADAEQAIASNTAAMGRNLARYGLNPNSGRAMSAMSDNAMRGAAIKAGSMNNARRFVEDKKFGVTKDMFATMTGLQSDAANSAGSAANGFMNMANAANRQDANEAAGWGNAAGIGLSMIDKFKDGGRVKGYARGGLVSSPQWTQPVARSAPPAGGSAGAGLADGLSMGKNVIKVAPRLAEGLSSVSPTAAGHVLQLSGNGVAGLGAEQLGMMAPEIANFGTASIADAAGTAAAAALPTAATAAAGAVAADTAGLGILEALGILALKDGGKVGKKCAKLKRGGKAPAVGTETSDSIPAMLSKNEYVLSAPAAKMVGYDKLDEINQMGLEMAGRA